jgi:hypothetical protein
MMQESVTTTEGEGMAWYQIINAKSDSYLADREAEDLLRQLGAVLRSTGDPVDAEIFYGRTTNGARRYYLSLSPEAADLADRVLASYDATALAEPPDLTGMEQIRGL